MYGIILVPTYGSTNLWNISGLITRLTMLEYQMNTMNTKYRLTYPPNSTTTSQIIGGQYACVVLFHKSTSFPLLAWMQSQWVAKFRSDNPSPPFSLPSMSQYSHYASYQSTVLYTKLGKSNQAYQKPTQSSYVSGL